MSMLNVCYHSSFLSPESHKIEIGHLSTEKKKALTLADLSKTWKGSLTDREFCCPLIKESDLAKRVIGTINADVLPYLKFLQQGRPTHIIGYSLEFIAYNILSVSSPEEDSQLRDFYKQEAMRVGKVLDVLDPKREAQYTMRPYKEPMLSEFI